jgi:serine/threonine protein kinase
MEGKLRGNYTLGKILGKGSFGEVYEARLEGDQNLSAVKVYSKSILNGHPSKTKIFELIQNETESMQKLNHRNLLKIYKYLESSNNIYLFLEYCEGGDLSNVLTNSGPLEELVVKKIAIELISGFIELDKQKIMHRDMKLENVMICKGRFVICDFGFSKVNQIQTSTHLGTQIYMAPEIAGGKYDNRVDVWSPSSSSAQTLGEDGTTQPRKEITEERCIIVFTKLRNTAEKDFYFPKVQ